MNRLDFAHVGPPGNGHGRALAKQTAGLGRGEEGRHVIAGLAEAVDEFGRDEFGQVFLGKIHGGLGVGEPLGDALLKGVYPLRECARSGGPGGLEPGAGACADSVDDGFGLHQVDAPVKEGALGEFAGTGQACARGKTRFHERVQRARRRRGH